MRTVLLLLIVSFSVLKCIAQVVCAGVSPSSIVGNYNFTWSDPANGWSSPDFNVVGTSVTGELMLVDDGSIGNSPASGLPLANYGCANLVNSLTGKIAVVYRYDGVTASTICWMSEKAKYAQDAGAIGVVIVNRPGVSEELGNGGGTAASSVTIPVVLISYEDGALFRSEMQNGPVTVFLGNKSGLFTNDIGIVKDSCLISTYSSIPPGLAQNGTDFNFDLGTRVYNYGTIDQATTTVTATVTGPLGTTVFTNTVGPLNVLAGSSIDVLPGATNSFPVFSLASYPEGKYTLKYSVSTGGTDNFPGDNESEFVFYVNDTLLSYSFLDPATLLPKSSAGYRPSTNNSTYSVCMVLDHPNSDELLANGMYFSASTAYGSGVSLTGEEMYVSIQEWNDVFTDLNDANLAFNSLNNINFGYYYYPSDLQGQTVFAPFQSNIQLQSDKRYLACVQTTNTNIYLGHDIKSDYTWNINNYLQAIAPNESDGTYYALGFGGDKISAIGMAVCDLTTNECGIGINETSKEMDIKAYPNPANSILSFDISYTGKVVISAQDISGKNVLTKALLVNNGTIELSIANLESGIYIFNLEFDKGNNSQLRIIKE